MSIGWLRNNTSETSNSHVIPDGSTDELHLFRLVLSAHLYQVMATYREDDDESMTVDEQPLSSPEDDHLIKLYTMANGGCKRTIDAFKLRIKLKQAIVEFARPVALFYHALTLVPPPEALKGCFCNEK